MSGMFQQAVAFTSDLSGWNVKNVECMWAMFAGATSFNSDISIWDVTSVTNMKCMFDEASSFNCGNGDLSRWDTRFLLNMMDMFRDATSFNKATIKNWNLPNLEHVMQYNTIETRIASLFDSKSDDD